MDPSFLQDLNRKQERAYLLLLKKDYSEARKEFEDLFEQGVANAAGYLGYIFSQTGSPEYDTDKAIFYFSFAAKKKDTHAQYSLGALFEKLGNLDEALRWYCEGSELGHGTCSYLASREFKRRGDAKASDLFFLKSLEQGSPPAIHMRSIQKMKGDFGRVAILPGLFEYVGNMPRMWRFIKENVRRAPT